jgi:3'-5' exoribonuclease
LLGHILIALRMVEEQTKKIPGFPQKLKLLVEHLIAAHHGTYEFGSPKLPCFLEAMLLHHLDNLDSKMEAIRVAIGKDALVEGNWTGYVYSLERSLLKKDKFLEDEPEPNPQSEFASKLTFALKPPQ